MPTSTPAEGSAPPPKVQVTVRQDGTGEVVIGDTVYPIAEPTLQDARRAATSLVIVRGAQAAGGPVRVQTSDPAGPSILIVYPNGDVEFEGAAAGPATSGSARPTAAAPVAPGAPLAESDGMPRAGPPADVPRLPPGRHARRSFITAEDRPDPAQAGVRGALTRLGVHTKPSAKEQALRSDIQLVSQHWAGPRTMAIANPKGSANKTPTTVCLSAVFARYGGGPVLAWDNNETRGTAAWRTLQGPHEATVLDLLPKTNELLGVGAQAAALARHVHHQPADKYDVLWSDQSTEGEHEVTGDEVDAIHEVAAKDYRLIFVDSGNSERAGNWRSMIRHTDSLVVPCTNVEDTAEAGARMLEALAQRDQHSADLARNAVAVVSQRTPGNDPNLRRIVRDFAPLVRKVVTIPHDPALYSGVIRFDALRPATQRAWLAAGAAVADGL